MAKLQNDVIKLNDLNFKFDKILQFDGREYTVAVVNGKAGIVDYNGNQITDFIYDDLCDEFPYDSSYGKYWMLWGDNEKYFKMCLHGKWGLLDRNGNVVLDFKYSYPVHEWCGNFKIMIDNEISGETHFFIMDKDKNIHAELNFDDINTHSQYAIVAKNNMYGVIDSNFKTIIPLEYENLNAISSDKFMSALKDGKWGVLDFNGNIILDFMFDNIDIEQVNGKHIFRAFFQNKFAIFDENGMKIL